MWVSYCVCSSLCGDTVESGAVRVYSNKVAGCIVLHLYISHCETQL